jgi:hypothetical protein
MTALSHSLMLSMGCELEASVMAVAGPRSLRMHLGWTPFRSRSHARLTPEMCGIGCWGRVPPTP